MKFEDIKVSIQNVLGAPLKEKDAIASSKNGVYECNCNGENYIIAMIGASGRDRSFAQMQKGLKPRIISAYEQSKKEQNKFFLMVPDSDNFECDDYYIFIELLEKGGESSSFELKVPVLPGVDHPIRVANKRGSGKTAYYITYVPSKDNEGNHTDEYLKQYLFSFDSRPYSRYITKIIDFLPSKMEVSKTIEATAIDSWPCNFLLAGAPGTGKSYSMDRQVSNVLKRNIYFEKMGDGEEYSEDKIEEILNKMALEANVDKETCFEIIKNERVRRVTFYEDYSYESFIGCYKPIPTDQINKYLFDVKDVMVGTEKKVHGEEINSQITYKFEPGPFINTYVDATLNKGKIYFLLIEEINRAKAASVFGDMFQLLDRVNGISEYAVVPENSLDSYLRCTLPSYKGSIKLPSNMYIWATMNNADQGVYPLDSAFKRRWGYLYLDVNSSNKQADLLIGEEDKVRWNIFRKHLNDTILNYATEDKCIGAWYFKDDEFRQIEAYFAAKSEDRFDKINPLSDKLLIYLMNDICRMNPDLLFQDDYQNMPAIREGMRAGIGLRDMLKLDWNNIDQEQKEWSEQQDIDS